MRWCVQCCDQRSDLEESQEPAPDLPGQELRLRLVPIETLLVLPAASAPLDARMPGEEALDGTVAIDLGNGATASDGIALIKPETVALAENAAGRDSRDDAPARAPKRASLRPKAAPSAQLRRSAAPCGSDRGRSSRGSTGTHTAQMNDLARKVGDATRSQGRWM